ncbi:MAG: polyprenyl synthetase family protein [Oscillospiraceae bacterium]|nr:polyprenyl synthetase family protein [Oscillospiraceae bacterium]
MDSEIVLTQTETEIITNKLKYNAGIINAGLEKYLNLSDGDYNVLYESMRYSSFAGGKRIRAFLALEFFSLFNQSGDIEIIFPVACAIEMIHTYSLIHDDLPCMDNDDLRRGLPTNHKKFGEATALLAGDALLTFAFNIIAGAEFINPDAKIRIISEISKAAGHSGMIGGQMMDMLYASHQDKQTDIIRLVKLIKLHTLKTGNMIMVSARSGCIAGGASPEETDLATEYAKNIGLAFQVVDDILDKTGDSAFIGKNTGSDEKNNKITFVDILGGIDGAFDYARILTLEALANLKKLKEINKDLDTSDLEIFAKYLLYRTM